MSLLTNGNVLGLWRDTIKYAEDRCSISLEEELEAYLITLLVQYTQKPELVKQILADAFLKAQQLRNTISLQQVGDQCLLYAGLFPHAAEKKLVKVSYFVDLGRSAYTSISNNTNDLFSSLAFQFVILMDVLQSIRPHPDLLPLEAYEQWNDLGSQRAFKLLAEYTHQGALPLSKKKKD